MITKEDLVYRQIFTLKDGARVLVRPLVHDDRQALVEFFEPISQDDRRYMRHDISDPETIRRWAEEIDYDQVFPLIAEVNHRIVGVATLHINKGPARHRAELRIFLAKDFRRRGVGSRLIQGLIEIAKRRSLYLVEVQIVSDQHHIIKAFQNFGFQVVCTYDDYFMLPDGDLRDVAHLILHLRAAEEQF